MRNEHDWGRRLLRVLGLALVFLLLSRAFAAAGTAARFCGSAGLRYTGTISPAQQQTAAKAAQAMGLDLAFWAQTGGTARSEATGRSAAASGIACAGQPSLCLPAEYLSGSAPGPLQTDSCAVSAALARALWGSVAPLGQVLVWQGAPYKIVGVFEGEDALLLYPAAGQSAYANVELGGIPPDDPHGTALRFLQSAGLAGLEASPYLLAGPMLYWVVQLFCALPLLAAGLWLLALCLRRCWAHPLLLFAVGLAAALALPLGLSALPRWLVPGQWSDFTFWADTFGQITAQFGTLAALPATARDSALAGAVWQTLACGAGGGVAVAGYAGYAGYVGYVGYAAFLQKGLAKNSNTITK